MRSDTATAVRAKSVRSRVEGSRQVAGIALTNGDKRYFPEDGITKLELARYYETVASVLLPHVAGRPLSLVRCPDGWSGQCFYQKHADRAVNAAVARIEAPEAGGSATYLSAASAAALIGLVQWGVIELHPWAARAPRLDRPDRLIFDLDPDDKLPWNDLVIGVRLLKTLLDEIRLRSFLKTTGGKGLHVVVPIRATLTWDDAKSFSRSVAEFLARSHPERFTTSVAKHERAGRIFIDYLRNAQGATAVAPYGVRARAHAPVATPIDWAELRRDVRFHCFHVRNVPARIARAADPWADYFATRQSITQSMRKRLG